MISSDQQKKLYKNGTNLNSSSKKQSSKEAWHSDITFEPVPSDYAILRLTQLPKTGGDTLWASGYEVYDRISPPLQKFLETLTATYAQPRFNKTADENGFKLYSKERGAPENVGDELVAEHPVIRTNPVTGWKSVFAVGHHVQHINGLTEAESKHFLDWFVRLIVDNHDLQVRHRWVNPNDLGKFSPGFVVITSETDFQQLSGTIAVSTMRLLRTTMVLDLDRGRDSARSA